MYDWLFYIFIGLVVVVILAVLNKVVFGNWRRTDR